MKSVALAVLLAQPLAAIADTTVKRSTTVVRDFKRLNPCPVTGATRGACPGYEIDHIEPLCAGGADRLDNLQWLSHDDHRAKTRIDVMRCRRMKSPRP